MSTRKPLRQHAVLATLAPAAIAMFFVLGAMSLGAPPSAADDNWPRFLGPTGIPVGTHPNLPTSWSTTENVEWSAEIDGMGWSSPIVWGDRVFVTSATSEQPMKQPSLGVDFSNDYVAELQAQGLSMEEILAKIGERDTEYPHEIDIALMLYCLDLESGELVWERQLHSGPPAVGRHRKNSFASETPVTDGEAIYVYFAHQGLYAYDLDGNELWTTPLEAHQVYLDFGGGTSPALHGERLYVVNDNEGASFVAAFDKRTGEEIWRTRRADLRVGRGSTWSSPFVWENDQRTELITVGPLTAVSYDLDGNELWRMGKLGMMPIATPFAWEGLLYLTTGPPGGNAWPMAAIAPGASGDITLADGATSSEHVVWFDWKGGVYLSTPVLYDGAIYVLQDKGILTKHDAKSGEILYRSRIGPGASAFTSSPWAYNGKIFALSEEGDTFVMSAGDEFELLGTNSLGEFALATPAMVGDRLLIRTQHRLWSIREENPLQGASVSAESGAVEGDDAAPLAGPLTFGGFTASFDVSGEYHLEGEGWPEFRGSWETMAAADAESTELVLVSPEAPEGCEGPGRYEIHLDGPAMTLRALDEGCGIRGMILDGSTWRAAGSAPAFAERRISMRPGDTRPLPAPASAEESWPSFRGPSASGVSDGQDLPDVWDGESGENIRWRTTLPGLGHASPVVWGDRLFVTTAVSSADGGNTFRPGLYGDGDASADRAPEETPPGQKTGTRRCRNASTEAAW